MVNNDAKITNNSEGAKEIDKYKIIADELAQFAAQCPSEEEDAKEVSGLLSALRPELRKVVEDIAEGTQCRAEIPLVYMVGIASIALGYKVSLASGDFVSHPNVNIVVVARSGEGKSRPLELLEKPLADAQEAELTRYRQELETAAPEEKYKIHRRKFFTNDTTMEALKRDIVFNPDGVSVIKDEGVLNALGAYKDSGGRDNDDTDFLTFFNCKGFEVNRKGDKENTMSAPHSFSTWLGGTQPKKLRKMFDEDRIESGMLARFLFAWPQPVERDFRQKKEKHDYSAWAAAVGEMINLSPVELVSTPEAEEIFVQFQQQEERHRMTADDCEASWFAKSQTYIFHVAIILHYLGAHHQSAVLDEDDARHATAFMGFFSRQWLRVLEYIRGGVDWKAGTAIPDAVASFYNFYLKESQQKGEEIKVSQNQFANLFGISSGYMAKLMRKYKT